MRCSFISEHRLVFQNANPNEGLRPPEAGNQPEGSYRRVQDRVDNMTPDQAEQARALMEQRQMLRDVAGRAEARLPQSGGFTVQSNDYSVVISRGNDCLALTLTGGTMESPQFDAREVTNGRSVTVPFVTLNGTFDAAVDSFVRQVNPPPVTRPQQPSSRIDYRTDDVRPEWESDPLRAMDALSRDLRQQYSGTPGVNVSLVPTNHPAMQGRPGGEVIRITVRGTVIELKLKMYNGTDNNGFAKQYARAEAIVNGQYQKEIELSQNDRGAFLGCKDYIDGVLTSVGSTPRPPLDAAPGAREPREAAPAQPAPGAEARPSQTEAAPRGPSYEMLQANVMPILQSIPGTRVDWYQSPNSTMLYVTPAGREVPIVTVEYSTNYNMYSVSVIPTADRPARMSAVGSFRASNEGWRQELKDTVLSRLGPLDVPQAQPQPQPAALPEQAPDLRPMQQLGEQVRGMLGADAAAYDIRVSAAGILVTPKNGTSELFFAATNGGFAINVTIGGTAYDTSRLTDFNQAVQAFKALALPGQPAAAVPDRAQPQPAARPEAAAENPLEALKESVKQMLGPDSALYDVRVTPNGILVDAMYGAGTLTFRKEQGGFSIGLSIRGQEQDTRTLATFDQAIRTFVSMTKPAIDAARQPAAQPPRVPDTTRPPEAAPANPLNALAEQVRGLVAAYPAPFRPDVSVIANGIVVRDTANGNTLTFTQGNGGFSIELVTGGIKQDVSRITSFADAVRALHVASTTQPARPPDAPRLTEFAQSRVLMQGKLRDIQAALTAEGQTITGSYAEGQEMRFTMGARTFTIRPHYGTEGGTGALDRVQTQIIIQDAAGFEYRWLTPDQLSLQAVKDIMATVRNPNPVGPETNTRVEMGRRMLAIYTQLRPEFPDVQAVSSGTGPAGIDNPADSLGTFYFSRDGVSLTFTQQNISNLGPSTYVDVKLSRNGQDTNLPAIPFSQLSVASVRALMQEHFGAPRAPQPSRPPEAAPANPLNAVAEQVRGLIAAYPATFRPDVSVTANSILVRDASNGNTLTFTQANGGFSIELVTGGTRQDVSRITSFADAVRALHVASMPQPATPPAAPRPAAPETSTETFRGSGIRIDADNADLEDIRNMPVLPEFRSLMLANNSRFYLRKVGGLNAVQTTYAITEESNGRDIAIAHINGRTATPPSPLVWQQELVTKLQEYLRTNPTAPARPAPPPERPQPAPAPAADTLSAPERIGTITLSFGPGAREFLQAKGIIIGPLQKEGVTKTCIYKMKPDGVTPERMFVCDDGDVGTARMTVDGGLRIDGIDATGKATMVFIKADGTNANVYFGQNIDRNTIRNTMYVVTPEEKAAMASPNALSGGLSAAPANLMTQYGMFMKDGKLIINPRRYVDPARPSAGLLTFGGESRGLSGVINPEGGWDLELGNGQFSQLTWKQMTLQRVVDEMNPANGSAAITAGGWGVDGTMRSVLQYTGSDGHTGYLVFSNDPSRPRILSVCSGGSATFAMKDNLRGGGRGLMILKPVIYVYPEKTTDVEVSIGLQDAQFSALYPKMTDDKWSVTASPDGQLTDKVTGKEYSYLFWEAQAQKPFAFDDKTAHCVAGKDSETFLEESLTTMGLNTKERNDFIVFWLPRMESSDYNLVHFITDEYVKRTPLTVTPVPDTVIRVYMVLKPVAGMQKTQPSTLLRGTRKGFTVVEWGGSKLDESPMVIE